MMVTTLIRVSQAGPESRLELLIGVLKVARGSGQPLWALPLAGLGLRDALESVGTEVLSR